MKNKTNQGIILLLTMGYILIINLISHYIDRYYYNFIIVLSFFMISLTWIIIRRMYNYIALNTLCLMVAIVLCMFFPKMNSAVFLHNADNTYIFHVHTQVQK